MAEIAFGAIAVVLLAVFLGGYIYDTQKHNKKFNKKP